MNLSHAERSDPAPPLSEGVSFRAGVYTPMRWVQAPHSLVQGNADLAEAQRVSEIFKYLIFFFHVLNQQR